MCDTTALLRQQTKQAPKRLTTFRQIIIIIRQENILVVHNEKAVFVNVVCEQSYSPSNV